jgi:hypothetical protein
MKKFKYAIPLLTVSCFPFYWEFLSGRFAWLTADVPSQAFLSGSVIFIIGGAVCLFLYGP